MSLPVLIAVTGAWEAALVGGLERAGRQVVVVRRCVDLADLLATAATGRARAAVLSADLRRLDRDALVRLASAGVAVVGLVEPGDEDGEQRLRRLGVTHVLPADTAAAVVAGHIAAAVVELAAGGASGDAGADAGGGASAGDVATGHGPVGKGPAGNGAVENSAVENSAVAEEPAGEESAGDGPAAGTRVTALPGRHTAGSRLVGLQVGDPAAAMASAPSAHDLPPGARTPGGRLVAVWGPAGAPGRTTVAVTLSAELAASVPGAAGSGPHGEVLLADADTYAGSVSQVLGLLEEAPGLAAAVRSAGAGQLDVAQLARLAPRVEPGLRVLTGLSRAHRWPELRPGALETVWEVARELATWTIVDCGFCLEQDEELSYDTAAPRRNGATLTTLASADHVLAVGAADPVGLQRLVRGLQDLAEVLPGVRPTVVVNRVRASAVGSDPQRRVREALARYAGVEDPVLVPEDRSTCDSALLRGLTLTAAAPAAPARLALLALARRTAGAPAPSPRRRRLGLARR